MSHLTQIQNTKIQQSLSQINHYPITDGQIVVNRSRTWTRDELYLIAAFLYHNYSKFQSQSAKKQFKIFKLMSAFVKTRNINQCRSYTNRMLKSFRNIQNINQYFKESLPQYEQVVAEMRERNEALISRQQTLMQGEYSNNQMQHSLDKNMSETTASVKALQKNGEYFGIIVPNVVKWKQDIPRQSTVSLPASQNPHHQEILDLYRRQYWEWALNFNYLPFFGKQLN